MILGIAYVCIACFHLRTLWKADQNWFLGGIIIIFIFYTCFGTRVFVSV